jgi:hypothetical protein
MALGIEDSSKLVNGTEGRQAQNAARIQTFNPLVML